MDAKIEKSTEALSSSESSDDNDRAEIQADLKNMSFEEIMKLKEELGAKVYKEAVLGESRVPNSWAKSKIADNSYKRLNKNRPREMSTKRQVPLLGLVQKEQKNTEIRDPRFDEKCGSYNVQKFKDNYKFVSKIRRKEIAQLHKQLKTVGEETERKKLKETIQRLTNKNVEERNWHAKQTAKKREREEIQKAHMEGKKPHYMTKKERRAQELVTKFEELKKTGKLNKHLEKRRKKNAAKDRKKFNFD